MKSWDQKLYQAEFAHNHVVNQNYGFKPFTVVYSVVPFKHLVLFTGDSSDDSDSRPNSVHPGENDLGIEEQAIRFLEKWEKLK